jgi:hypothetical protein
MALLLPGARVIACDRDPRDIGLSIFTYRFYGVHAYANDLSDLGCISARSGGSWRTGEASCRTRS